MVQRTSATRGSRRRPTPRCRHAAASLAEPLKTRIGSLAVLALILYALTPGARALDAQRHIAQYGYQSWQTDSGLPQNTVHAVLQSRDGYIWLATEGGLVRFDGIQFQVFDKQNTPQLRSSFINNLFEDRSGALWIATADGLTRREAPPARPGFSTFTTDSGLPSNSVWSVYQDRSGALWALTAEGIARYRDGRFEPIPIPQGLSSSSSIVEMPDGSLRIGTSSGLLTVREGRLVYSPESQTLGHLEIEGLAYDRSGQLWIGTREGLRILSSGKIAGPPLEPALATSQITTVFADSLGRVWIGTDRGLAVSEAGRMRLYTTGDGLAGNRIETLYEDREHSLWASTDRGLARIANGRVESFTPANGLSSNLVLSIFEDREGSLWLGTESGGINILRDQKFSTYTTKDGLTDDLVRSVFQDRRGTIWIGTNGGGLNRFDGHAFTPVNSRLSSAIILALADDPEGNLWVGTPDGLNRIHDGRVTLFTSADGLADDFVRSLYTARDGSLWIGTRRGLSHFAGGKFTSYSRMDGLGSDLVGAILEDLDGSLWIGTLGGLSHFNGTRFTNYTTQNGLSSNVITALYQDAPGTLWIGTNGGGLNRMRGGHVDRYITPTMPDNIYAILEDAGNNLWLSSNSGIYRAGRNQLNAVADGKAHSLLPVSYGIADGMKISECSSGGHPAAWKLADGTLWFATLKGIAGIDPAHTSTNTKPPLVVIEQVSIDDQPAPAGQPLTLGPGHTRFSFQYAGLSFVAPQKVRYQYRLEGFEHEWVDAGSRRTAYYTNIPPGHYRFRVQASNNDGLWDESPASFAFSVRPHFYQAWWFYVAVAAALALLAYGIYRWRVHRVESQFRLVLAERNRIAREIHDTLAQGFVAVSVQLEIVARLLGISGDSARQHLEQARQLVRHSLDEARTSIWDLRSQGTGQEDLATRLSRTAERLTATTPIKAQLKITGTYRPLAANIETELLRIGQEAINNAVRHAQPRNIAVGLEYAAQRVRMTISDDGLGFTPGPGGSSPHGHYGLTGMQERADQIGATLNIASAPGEGTEVTLDAPVA